MTSDLRRQFASATGVLSVAMLAASAANYALNLGLARLLDPAEFGDATLMVTLLLGLTAAGVALQLITARAVSTTPSEAGAIRTRLATRSGRGGMLLALVTACAAPVLRDLLHTGSALPFIALGAGLPIYLVQSVDRGVLQGRLEFGRLAASFAVEAAVRLLGGLALVAVGFGVTGATVALSLSFLGSWWTLRPARSIESADQATTVVDTALAASSRATVLLLVGQIIINNGDVIWAKQLLDPATAGSYAAVALVGRAVFFCSWAVANAAFPLASAEDDDASSVLTMGIAAVTAMSVAAVAAIAALGDRLGPLMFGSSIDDLPGLFVPYAVATGMFAVANLIATVDVARGRMDTALAVVGGGILQTVLLVRFGSSPETLVDMQVVAMALLLAGTALVHRGRREVGATLPRGGATRARTRHMNERVRTLAESDSFLLAPVAYSILDVDGRQIAANPAFRSLFRTDQPVHVTEITHERDRELTASYLADLLSGASDRVVVEKRYLRGDGATFWGRLTASAVRDPDGEVDFLIGIIEDITAQYDALTAVQAASDAKSSFVARVSHDLRTPLHAIRGMAELLTLADLDSGARGFAVAIRKEADTLRALVDDLLDLSRLEAGQVELNPIAFPLGAYIRGAVDLLREQATAKGIELEVAIDRAVDREVWGDGERLRQVLVNLMDNAVKFTDSGSVKVGARAGERDDVVLTVRDTGVGIEADMVARIFEPFGRAHEDRTGTGLGLTICRDLIERMGGSLELESALREGSLFTIRVPLPPALGHEVAAITTPEAPRSDTAPPFVLVVEDSPINQLLAAAQLDQLGCRHEIAATGMEALAAFSRTPFDLVLMDWHLPDMDGLETTQWLRAIEAEGDLGRVPVVAVTARTMTGDRQRCLDAGMDDFLSKPVGMDDLAGILREWLPDGVAARVPLDAVEPSEPVADTDAIQRLLDDLGDRALVATLVRTFLDELPDRVTTIIGASASDDLEAVRRAAHTLKSTSAIVGATDLSYIASQLETQARADEAPADEQVAALEAAAERVVAEFTKILATLEHV